MTRRKRVSAVLVAVAVLVALHGAAWLIVADRLEDGIVRWTQDRRQEGWTVRYSALDIGSYPFAWRARVGDPALTTKNIVPPVDWSGPRLTLDWKPWEPRRVGYAADGGHRLDLAASGPAGAARLDVAQATGEILFDAAGRMSVLSLVLGDAALETPAKERVAIDRLAMTLDGTPAPRTDPTTQGRAILRLDIAAAGVTLPESAVTPLGRTVGSIDLDATVIGRPGSGNLRETLAVWRDGGGIVEVDRFGMNWSRLDLDATGTLALDGDMQPVVATTSTLRGYNETLDALVGAGVVAPGESLVARMAFRLLERTTGDGNNEIRLALTVQDRWLYVGPVKLLRLPPIDWNRLAGETF